VNARGWWIPPRDWGRRTLFPVMRLTGSTDHGAVMSVGLNTTGYGFRKDPWADQQSLRFSYATRPNRLRGEYLGRFRFENSKLEAGVRARASGFEQLRFYGFGNETSSDLPDDLYRVHQDHYVLDLTLSFPLSRRTTGFVGGRWKRVTTEERPGAPLLLLRPYGIGDTRQLGAIAGLELDTTDRSGLPHRGFRMNVAGSGFPEMTGLEHSFGELHADATAYMTKWATLALRAGGKGVFGTYPFYEAAFLGGSPSLRGLRLQRYAGDSMLHGGADLYLPVTKAFLLVPGEVGVFGLGDVGRVYLDGEASDRWHSGFGGGLYFVSPNRNNRVELSYARSEGRNGFYLRLGLALP
jgi:outer membrane protein assembly factor BamA